eukprot:TRINITY_DN2530_c1_g1_i1.p1 TRINITY_DN2530_c1_g1~~TRINITY_DN2530_c1_g1_i1.p1  ORF type:complete len:365 (+),score=112.53 TRINITY_DN2530_c1_g1_i1:67-1095(+)
MATLNEMYQKAVKQHCLIEQHTGDGNDKGKQELVAECFQQFQDLWRAVDQRKVFSRNEEIDDLATGDVKFFLVLYYLGDLQEKKVDSNRVSNLRNAITCFKAFFRLSLDYGLINEKEHDMLTSPVNPTDRMARIDRLKKQRELQAKLAELADKKKQLSRNINNEVKVEGGGDAKDSEVHEGVERQYWLLAVEVKMRVCSQQYSMSMREVEMLSSLTQEQKTEAAEDYQKRIEEQKGVPPRPGDLKVIESVPSAPEFLTQLSMDREKILSEVFIDRNPATMSDAEYARIQMERMLPPDEPKNEDEDEDTSDDEVNTRKQKKASNWDDWKDDHARDGNMGANIG